MVMGLLGEGGCCLSPPPPPPEGQVDEEEDDDEDVGREWTAKRKKDKSTVSVAVNMLMVRYFSRDCCILDHGEVE